MKYEDERDQSEFNMAVSYLGRLNALFYTINEASISLDIYNWFHGLIVLFRELSTEMKKEEREEYNESIYELHSLVNKYIEKKNKGDSSVPPELYRRLHEFEIEMRALTKDAGLQQKTKERAEEALR